jgi:hypothetical protein
MLNFQRLKFSPLNLSMILAFSPSNDAILHSNPTSLPTYALYQMPIVPNEHSYMQLPQCTLKCASITQMHTNAPHKHTLAPRRINCAPMHLQSQNSALNGSHLHQCLLKHSKCTQPIQIKCSMNHCAQIHLNDLNQDLQCWNVHTCTCNASKYLQRALIKHLCTSKLQMASKTSKLLQSSSKLLQGSKSASKTLQKCKLASPTHTNPQDLS